MHSYAAFLGINPSISIAELAAVLPDMERGHLFPSVLTFSTATEIDQAFLDKLGGTILIAKRITGDCVVTLNDVPALLTTEAKGIKGKVTFALRFIGVNPNRTRDFYKQCKTALKMQSMPSRYIGNEREPAKPIQLHDEGILDPKHGCEIVVLQDKEQLWIGRTVGAQNVKAYTLRDMEKPVRDTTVGLLPPKLAQILLNFGEFLIGNKMQTKNFQPTVFDPFCGTGVIPMEALLRGWNVLASDKAEKAVTGTTKNLEWLRKKFEVAKKDATSSAWKQDAIKPFEIKELPDVIVTEGTLGPALRSRPTVKDAEGYCRDADNLAIDFLTNCSTTLKGVPIVMILPMWYAQKKQIQLTRVWEKMDGLGYRPVLPPHTDPLAPDRFSLLYRRSDQFVGREIVLLKPR